MRLAELKSQEAQRMRQAIMERQVGTLQDALSSSVYICSPMQADHTHLSYVLRDICNATCVWQLPGAMQYRTACNTRVSLNNMTAHVAADCKWWSTRSTGNMPGLPLFVSMTASTVVTPWFKYVLLLLADRQQWLKSFSSANRTTIFCHTPATCITSCLACHCFARI